MEKWWHIYSSLNPISPHLIHWSWVGGLLVFSLAVCCLHRCLQFIQSLRLNFPWPSISSFATRQCKSLLIHTFAPCFAPLLPWVTPNVVCVCVCVCVCGSAGRNGKVQHGALKSVVYPTSKDLGNGNEQLHLWARMHSKFSAMKMKSSSLVSTGPRKLMMKLGNLTCGSDMPTRVWPS